MTQSPLVSLNSIQKSFGAVQALDNVNLLVETGKVLGIVGHNGAGKSTLMKVLAGTLAPDSGEIQVDGVDVAHGYSVRKANALGIRCIFQELSLCPNLRVYENVRLVHPSIRGVGWRTRARRLIKGMLDTIFPGHSINSDSLINSLSISERQMVEIARAFTVTKIPLRMVILDEPTASLDSEVAEQLMSFIRHDTAEQNITCILVSHRLSQVIKNTDHIVVMRDGTDVAYSPTDNINMSQVLENMGVEESDNKEESVKNKLNNQTKSLRVSTQIKQSEFQVYSGEIVGLAGLAGHGQHGFLLELFASAKAGRSPHSVYGTIAYVSGDRQTEGIFPLWSVGHNLTIGMLSALAWAGVINSHKERQEAENWRQQINIKTPDIGQPIGNLSGGNQQKVLVARAFASKSDIILFDDPLRGVDVGTKNEMFQHVKTAADQGHTFLWYTTETSELYQCDRVYVFYEGRITDHIEHADLDETRLVASSFGERNDDQTSAASTD